MSHNKYKLHTIKCSQCGEPIAYTLTPYAIDNPHCFLCMLSFLELAELLNGTHMENETNFSTKVELYANTGTDSTHKKQQTYRTNCIKLLKTIRS